MVLNVLFSKPHTNDTATQKLKKLPRTEVYRLQIPAGKNVDEMLTLYRQESSVEYAEANYEIKALAVPNDPFFSQQWGLQNTGQTGGTPGADIHAPEAWDVEKGSSSLVIAVIDTGCDLTHPDLAGKFVSGHDFVNNDSDPSDDNGHGTFCAGIAAAVTDNTVGIAGVSCGSKIMPVKVLDATGTGNYFTLADGIIHAADNGASVINLSLGGDTPNTTLEEAMKYAYAKGVVICAAAGNSGASGVAYPAAYTQYCLAVAATDNNDQRASFSSCGPEVDIAAPGVNIHSTYKDGTYKTASGTSASTPFVSGLAALLLSHDSTLTPGQVEWQIQATCDDVNATTYPGGDNYLGAGRINAARALGAGSSSPGTVDGTITFDYDKNGNLIKQVINRNNKYFTTNYAYDYENRLTGLTYPDNTNSTYRYDGGGKRIQSVEDSITTNYLYDGLSAIIEKNEAGVTHAFYNRGLSYGGGIGAVTGLTDVNAKLLQSYSYDAFGNALMVQGQGKGAKNITNPYGFSTKEYNAKSGLVYFGARYYDPVVGRFI
jgi:YD repeat-containing protein